MQPLNNERLDSERTHNLFSENRLTLKSGGQRITIPGNHKDSTIRTYGDKIGPLAALFFKDFVKKIEIDDGTGKQHVYVNINSFNDFVKKYNSNAKDTHKILHFDNTTNKVTLINIEPGNKKQFSTDMQQNIFEKNHLTYIQNNREKIKNCENIKELEENIWKDFASTYNLDPAEEFIKIPFIRTVIQNILKEKLESSEIYGRSKLDDSKFNKLYEIMQPFLFKTAKDVDGKKNFNEELDGAFKLMEREVDLQIEGTVYQGDNAIQR